jgi:hypothetical protein
MSQRGDHAILHHLAPTAAAFFGRLKDYHRGAVEIPRLGQIFRRAQQHGGVAIMTAGMHLAMGFRGIFHARRLDDRQRVHIGAQADNAARRIGLALDHAHNAGPPDAFNHLVASERPQQFHHLASRSLHVEQEFRVFVEIVAPGGDLWQQFGETVFGRHGGAPLG